jgi:hypothetical protein
MDMLQWVNLDLGIQLRCLAEEEEEQQPPPLLLSRSLSLLSTLWQL